MFVVALASVASVASDAASEAAADAAADAAAGAAATGPNTATAAAFAAAAATATSRVERFRLATRGDAGDTLSLRFLDSLVLLLSLVSRLR
jgi:hypothetical protein